MKVLAVDDEKVSREVMRLALSSFGHEVVVANDGLAAWELLKDGSIHVVVSDWLMPGIDGLELCRRVRSRQSEEYTYFILLTGIDSCRENRHQAVKAGTDDFLNKPLNPDDLWMRLHVAERILGFARQVRQLEAFLPICAYCKKIRDDKNYWQQIETYIGERTGTDFSHSICPECYETHMRPEIEKMYGKSSPYPNP